MPKSIENTAPNMFATAMPRRALRPPESTHLPLKILMMAPPLAMSPYAP
jgi:hypothetical protein